MPETHVERRQAPAEFLQLLRGPLGRELRALLLRLPSGETEAQNGRQAGAANTGLPETHRKDV